MRGVPAWAPRAGRAALPAPARVLIHGQQPVSPGRPIPPTGCSQYPATGKRHHPPGPTSRGISGVAAWPRETTRTTACPPQPGRGQPGGPDSPPFPVTVIGPLTTLLREGGLRGRGRHPTGHTHWTVPAPPLLPLPWLVHVLVTSLLRHLAPQGQARAPAPPAPHWPQWGCARGRGAL